MIEYTLVLRYPKGRTFHLRKQSDSPLKPGHEFDAYGRRWKIEHELRQTRQTPASLAGLRAFACNEIPGRTDALA